VTSRPKTEILASVAAHHRAREAMTPAAWDRHVKGWLRAELAQFTPEPADPRDACAALAATRVVRPLRPQQNKPRGC
jgi:hypothetical protein